MFVERDEKNVVIAFTIPVKMLQDILVKEENSRAIGNELIFQLDKWIKIAKEGLSCLG